MSEESVQAGHEPDDSDPRGYEAFKASLRKAAGKCESRRNEIKKYFRKPKNWISFGTLVFVAGYTIVSLWQLLEMQKQTVEANRAWIGPVHLQLLQPLESGLPDKVQLTVFNFGREPAIGLTWKFKPILAMYVPESADSETKIIAENDTCSNLHPMIGTGVSVYPSQRYELPETIENTPANAEIPNLVLTHKMSLFIQGCLGYITFGKPHFSRFEFFLRDEVKKPSIEWNFNLPADGNSAN